MVSAHVVAEGAQTSVGGGGAAGRVVARVSDGRNVDVMLVVANRYRMECGAA